MSGVRLDVRSNIDQILAAHRADTANIQVATVRALNRGLDKSATETSREIRKVYNLRDKAVKKALKKARASKGRLWAVLQIEGPRIALVEFDARWRPGQAGGATVKILVAGGRKVVPGAFIAANSRTGLRQVYRRVGKARFPIRTLRSVSIPQAFSNRGVSQAVAIEAEAEFVKTLEQQLNYLGGRDGG